MIIETSANTLAFAIAALAVYPDIQQKLHEESRRVWPTLDDIHSSTYDRDFGQFVSIHDLSWPFDSTIQIYSTTRVMKAPDF